MLDEKVKKLLARKKKLDQQVKFLQSECTHSEYEIKGNYNNHNGYDMPAVIQWYQDRQCNICEAFFTVKTGVEHYG